MSTVDPLTVPCSACLADPGERCYSTTADDPRPETHRMRRLAAARRLKRCEACESMGWVPDDGATRAPQAPGATSGAGSEGEVGGEAHRAAQGRTGLRESEAADRWELAYAAHTETAVRALDAEAAIERVRALAEQAKERAAKSFSRDLAGQSRFAAVPATDILAALDTPGPAVEDETAGEQG